MQMDAMIRATAGKLASISGEALDILHGHFALMKTV